jgi:ubiquinone/menaquinone biosynthesis C-methylase UbiE
MSWKRKLYYALSPKLRRRARRLYYFPVDLIEGLSGKRDELTPPRGKIFIGPGDFRKLGEKLVSDFIAHGHLKPDDRVLDIGCGIGRIAIPLTKYLSKKGTYNGFDIVKEGIDWCRQKISPRFPNFTFTHVDLKNDLYNLRTDQSASEFVFPYPDNSFDFIILTSVFTHMQPAEVEQYLREISRVMGPGGTCFATFFIIDRHSQAFLENSAKPFFAHDHGDYMLHDNKVRDANIAFKLPYIEKLLNRSGLRIEKFHPGWWAGRDRSMQVDFQDVLILKKQSD